MKKKNLFLLVVIFLALVTLIFINYCTIRIISATRSYINGESEYSKGQKDALLYLSTYILTGDTTYWTGFNESIKIPMGDNLARHSMLNNDKDSVTTSFLLIGKNNLNDIPDMIYIYKTFGTSFLKDPVKLWVDAEPMIDQIYAKGYDIHDKIKNNSLTEEYKQNTIKQLTLVSADLSLKESEFSRILSNKVRKVNQYLIFANVLFLFLIDGGIGLYAMKMIKRLVYANEILEDQNKELKETNNELDAFVYSVSHDLRAPITSIKGLIHILKGEKDIALIKEYIGLIDEVIDKQDIFILEILDLFKNKRIALSYNEFSLPNMIEDIIGNNKFSPMAQDIVVNKNMELDHIYADEIRVKMILNNLISNAIKYSDEQKQVRKVFIKTWQNHNNYIIEVEDNGIGIDHKYIDKIYDMFFVTSNSNRGTGLGLYILKQNIERLNGKVDVLSEVNIGTKFTVTIPLVK